MTQNETPNAFVLTKVQTDAGQSLDRIFNRKELERQSGGTFWWGIGESKKDQIGLLLAEDPNPIILFTRMLSRPHRRDSHPTGVLLLEEYETANGRKPLPAHAIVISRAEDSKGRPKQRYYALVCTAPRGILRDGSGILDTGALRPSDHVERATAHFSASYDAWTRAWPGNDFATMVPYLERTLDLSREYSTYFAPYNHVADPHIDDADEGMTAASIGKLFDELKLQLVPMVRAICEQPAADDAILRQAFPKAAQFEFALHVAKCLGYDLKRGRLDLTHHPFCTRFSAGDIRITTRIDEIDLGDTLFSTLHEAGHAMYEQAISAALDGTPLGRGVSAGVHESQSRLWENVVGRSSGFWEHFYPKLQRTFAEQLSGVPIAAFHRAINKVAQSLIRTDADEVTYNLHIMLRFDLENKLLEGKLSVKDLPEAWHAAMQADLDIAPSNDRDGCLQDAHWYSGYIGGQFQSYAIGNILSAQFYAAALKAHPNIPREIAKGEFGTLHTWLRDNLYRHGSKFAPNDLVERATGAVMQMRRYLDYLREKFGRLYQLPLGSDEALKAH